MDWVVSVWSGRSYLKLKFIKSIVSYWFFFLFFFCYCEKIDDNNPITKCTWASRRYPYIFLRFLANIWFLNRFYIYYNVICSILKLWMFVHTFRQKPYKVLMRFKCENTKCNADLNDRYHLNNGKFTQFIKYEHQNIALEVI